MEAAIAASTAVYVIGLLWFLLGATRRDRPIDSAGPKLPSVAVVIAARDEVAHIETCLRRMGAQCYPTDLYQVIVVDDGSTDGTLDKARTLAASMKLDGHRVLVLDGMATYGAGGSKKSALALGIGCCSDDIVLTTDADCDVPTGWIRNMVDHFGVQTGAVVGFSQIGIPGAPASVLASWEGLDFLQLMTAAAGSCALGHPMAASGQSLGFRRKAFDEVGGYGTVSHRVSGDDVLLLQLIRGTRHWRIGFCGEAAARVVHPPSPGLRSFLSRRARWASNAPLQLRLDPLFFCYMLGTFAASLALLTCLALWAAGLISPKVVAVVWGSKIAAEGALALAGALRFGRTDLLRVFPLWTLLQPVYTVLVGLVGPLGFFRWKGRRVALGRKSEAR
jgi:cellulose synthase/poly-beta-1,6-N-acetylglucosamine synthase-like glycosyltransferase